VLLRLIFDRRATVIPVHLNAEFLCNVLSCQPDWHT
jgi:hypothetical protein